MGQDFLSSTTSYLIGLIAFVLSGDLTTWTAVAALILVFVRIATDIPKAINSWINLFDDKEDDNDSSTD